MKLIAAALAAALTLFTPTGLDEAEAAKVVSWLNADEVELVVRQPSDPNDLNGGFIAAGAACDFFACYEFERPVVMLVAGENVPREVLVYILLHELGHYEQWKAMGRPPLREWMHHYHANAVEMEWAADVYALQVGCALGIDPGTLRAAFEWMQQHYDYAGDSLHGDVADRVAHGEAAVPSCSAGPAQAPFVAVAR